MPSKENLYSDRARIGALVRARRSDDPELLAARKKLAEDALANRIRRLVDAAPPLTPEQRDRLVTLLRPSGVQGHE
jgi:hypothetical protein